MIHSNHTIPDRVRVLCEFLVPEIAGRNSAGLNRRCSVCRHLARAKVKGPRSKLQKFKVNRPGLKVGSPGLGIKKLELQANRLKVLNSLCRFRKIVVILDDEMSFVLFVCFKVTFSSKFFLLLHFVFVFFSFFVNESNPYGYSS